MQERASLGWWKSGYKSPQAGLESAVKEGWGTLTLKGGILTFHAYLDRCCEVGGRISWEYHAILLERHDPNNTGGQPLHWLGAGSYVDAVVGAWSSRHAMMAVAGKVRRLVFSAT